MADEARRALETRWIDLTRCVLPGLAAEREWPIRFDHCFQRVLLDAAFGGVWYDHVATRPAYRALSGERLRVAVELAEAVAEGRADLFALNAQSLRWRAERRRR